MLSTMTMSTSLSKDGRPRGGGAPRADRGVRKRDMSPVYRHHSASESIVKRFECLFVSSIVWGHVSSYPPLIWGHLSIQRMEQSLLIWFAVVKRIFLYPLYTQVMETQSKVVNVMWGCSVLYMWRIGVINVTSDYWWKQVPRHQVTSFTVSATDF